MEKTEAPEKLKIKQVGKFRAVQFNFRKDNDVGWKEALKILWGFDIWMENVPIAKVLILANIIVWLMLFGRWPKN